MISLQVIFPFFFCKDVKDIFQLPSIKKLGRIFANCSKGQNRSQNLAHKGKKDANTLLNNNYNKSWVQGNLKCPLLELYQSEFKMENSAIKPKQEIL